jgi:formylglycine-generating enzyme required for sulfatase activity
MVPIGAGEYPIGAPSNHPLADRAAMPAHRVAINAFKIDRTEVTNEQFAEFLNALPVKPLGVAEGGKVGSDNIPREGHAIFLEFSSRPSPYTMIDLDDAEALIGVRGGRFAPNAGYDHHPVTETNVGGRACVLPLARRPTADGGSVGGCGTRPRWPSVSLGRRRAYDGTGSH